MKSSLQKWSGPLGLLFVGLVLFWALAGLETHAVNLAETLPRAGRIFYLMGAEFDGAYLFPDLKDKLIETVEMALLGTLLASLLAVPFGFLAASNMMKRFAGVGKFLLSVIRTFPEIILAIVFIKGVGPGPLSGIFAMGVHSVGMLGKLYSESIESIDRGPQEALMSTGANRVQQIWFAVIPQVLPEFASYALYRFEINSRAAAVLGIVGAGGIGAPLIFAIRKPEWGRVGVILLGIIIVVSLIDVGSGWLRRRLV